MTLKVFANVLPISEEGEWERERDVLEKWYLRIYCLCVSIWVRSGLFFFRFRFPCVFGAFYFLDECVGGWWWWVGWLACFDVFCIVFLFFNLGFGFSFFPFSSLVKVNCFWIAARASFCPTRTPRDKAHLSEKRWHWGVNHVDFTRQVRGFNLPSGYNFEK